MARYEFKLPDIGEGVGEGEIVGWLVQPGDDVKEDEPIVEVMTDKATVTITAPKAGKVLETRGRVGETVLVHAVLVVFEIAATSVSPRVNGASVHPAEDVNVPARASADLSETQPASPTSSRDFGYQAYFNAKPIATPATRKYARENSVDLRRVPPTGLKGRVMRSDVESFSLPTRSSDMPPGTADLGYDSKGLQEQRPRAADGARPLGPRMAAASDQRVPMVGLRRRIAQKMARSTSTAAHFTFVEECDVTALMELRGRLKDVARAHGAKLTYLPFIVKAVVAALKKHPILNTTLDEATEEIIFRKDYNIGIATATDAGLLVPVIKQADKKTLLEIAHDVERMSDEARAGKIKLDDLQGSTFTITSLGAKSGLFATPIINFPEVAILGAHQIKSKPVVRGGQIVVGDVMLLSLSFDHRIVDGHVGAAFAYEVIALLEHPERLLLEMA